MSTSRAMAVNFEHPQNHKTGHGCRALGSAPRDPDPADIAWGPGICMSQVIWLQVLRMNRFGNSIIERLCNHI